MVEKLRRLCISRLNSYSLKAGFNKRVVSTASPHLELNVGSKIADKESEIVLIFSSLFPPDEYFVCPSTARLFSSIPPVTHAQIHPN